MIEVFRCPNNILPSCKTSQRPSYTCYSYARDTGVLLVAPHLNNKPYPDEEVLCGGLLEDFLHDHLNMLLLGDSHFCHLLIDVFEVFLCQLIEETCCMKKTLFVHTDFHNERIFTTE